MLFFLLLVFAVISADGASYEGDRCDANGVSGVCRNLRNCSSALEDLKNRKRPTTCGFDNQDIIVCCINEPTATLTTTERPAGTTTEYIPPEAPGHPDYDYEDPCSKSGNDSCEPIPHQLTSKPTGQKAWDKCIEYQEKYVFPCEKVATLTERLCRVNRCPHAAEELIFEDTYVAPHDFPHMVLLGYENNKNEIDWECSGTLISEKFVLTAGHCISNNLRNDVSHALIGVLRRSEENASNRYGIKRIIKHDKYQPPIKYHDIALLELDRNVHLNYTTVPACLHTPEFSADDRRVFATGWSFTNPDKLQKVYLTKVTNDECSMYYGSSHNFLGIDEKTQVCYGGDKTGSKDTCQGNSGGPIQVKNKKISCMYTVVGVTSIGQGCGIIEPQIYTRTLPYLSWIENIVWPN